MALTMSVELGGEAVVVYVSDLGGTPQLHAPGGHPPGAAVVARTQQQQEQPGYPRIFQLQTTLVSTSVSGGWLQATGPQ
jgi:hypothetical protein